MFDPTELHFNSIVVDTHADTPQRFVDEAWNFTDPLSHGMLNLDAARRGGLTAEFLALWAEPSAWRGRFAFRTRQLLDATLAQIERAPDDLRLGLTPEDILLSKQDGHFCILLGIEGGHSIENSLDILREFHAHGVRYMTLTWSNSNEWAESSGDIPTSETLGNPTAPTPRGLTDFGREVVREMNHLGMMVDVSHVADSTFWDVLQTTHAPVIASHSSARALTPAPRNLTDEQLRAIATNNGVVMVNFYPSFISQQWREAWHESAHDREALYASAADRAAAENRPLLYGEQLRIDRDFYAQHLAAKLPLVPFAALIDHFDHVAQVAGIDHIGIGSDFDGFALLPAGLTSAADLPSITRALADRGYTADQLR
ncbi:MAG: dipeptidase, partial [Bryocella sp.]